MRGRLLVGRWELQLKLFCELWRLNREVKRSSSSSLLCRSRQNMSQYITTTFRPLLVRYVNKMLNICEISVVTNIIITNPALDLSIFPFSPEVNPTLTLVALALRLSRAILPRTPFVASTENTIYVMNQTGDPIKVFVSNRAGVTLTQEEIDENKNGKVLGPGEKVARERSVGVDETVMVYRLDYNSRDVYLPRPVPYIATPGRVCIIE